MRNQFAQRRSSLLTLCRVRLPNRDRDVVAALRQVEEFGNPSFHRCIVWVHWLRRLTTLPWNEMLADNNLFCFLVLTKDVQNLSGSKNLREHLDHQISRIDERTFYVLWPVRIREISLPLQRLHRSA